MLEALLAFMPVDEKGVGSISYSSEDRKNIAKNTRNYQCPVCNQKLKDHEDKILENRTKAERKLSEEVIQRRLSQASEKERAAQEEESLRNLYLQKSIEESGSLRPELPDVKEEKEPELPSPPKQEEQKTFQSMPIPQPVVQPSTPFDVDQVAFKINPLSATESKLEEPTIQTIESKKSAPEPLQPSMQEPPAQTLREILNKSLQDPEIARDPSSSDRTRQQNLLSHTHGHHPKPHNSPGRPRPHHPLHSPHHHHHHAHHHSHQNATRPTPQTPFPTNPQEAEEIIYTQYSQFVGQLQSILANNKSDILDGLPTLIEEAIQVHAASQSISFSDNDKLVEEKEIQRRKSEDEMRVKREQEGVQREIDKELKAEEDKVASSATYQALQNKLYAIDAIFYTLLLAIFSYFVYNLVTISVGRR